MRNLKGNRLTHKDKISYLKHHLTTILPIHHLTNFVCTIKPITITPSYLLYHFITIVHITLPPYYEYTILPPNHHHAYVITIIPSYLSYHLTTLHHFSTIITITPYTHNGYQYHQYYNTNYTILYLKHHLTITTLSPLDHIPTYTPLVTNISPILLF